MRSGQFLRTITSPSRAGAAIARRLVRGTITHVLTEEPVAALTFDDGPDPVFTPRLVDILERHGARGTFFMVGKSAERYPEVVRRVAEGGHAVGVHSWDHPSFPLISLAERRRQIRACEHALAPFGCRLFRPPFGHQTVPSYVGARLLGYEVIAWNIAVNDWSGDAAPDIRTRIEQKLHPGSIVLLHDHLFAYGESDARDRTPTLEAVDQLLASLQGAMKMVTIPELLKRGRPHRVHWRHQRELSWLSTLRWSMP